jgi:hypothetical protein
MISYDFRAVCYNLPTKIQVKKYYQINTNKYKPISETETGQDFRAGFCNFDLG